MPAGARLAFDPKFQVMAAVEAALTGFSGSNLIVACSGGPDSVALALATHNLAEKKKWIVNVVIVDHQWSELSAANAEFARTQLVNFGLVNVEVIIAEPTSAENREARAREIRLGILQKYSDSLNGAPVLLGHTKDDQAETVLMRLVRGSGSKALSGMSKVRGVFIRPLLDLDRSVVHESIPDTFSVIDDPANSDDTYLRVRVRKSVLPMMQRELGEDVISGLVRSAQLLRIDSAYFVEQTNIYLEKCLVENDLDVQDLINLHQAIRTRVIQQWLVNSGVPSGSLHQIHINTVDDLVVAWHGQKEINLPGGFEVKRIGNRLTILH